MHHAIVRPAWMRSTNALPRRDLPLLSEILMTKALGTSIEIQDGELPIRAGLTSAKLRHVEAVGPCGLQGSGRNHDSQHGGRASC